MKTAGDTVVMEKLAETYRRIAQEGKDTFYNGSLKDDIAADLSDIGTIGYCLLWRVISSASVPL